MRPVRFLTSSVGLVVALSARLLGAQQPATGGATFSCATPDSVAIRGLQRLPDADVRSDLGITPKSTISGRQVTQALKNLYATNAFEPNATASCAVIDGKNVLVFTVTERRILSEVSVVGPTKVSRSDVKDRVDLLIGKPIDPAQVA